MYSLSEIVRRNQAAAEQVPDLVQGLPMAGVDTQEGSYSMELRVNDPDGGSFTSIRYTLWASNSVQARLKAQALYPTADILTCVRNEL